jgi:hypothetical protein
MIAVGMTAISVLGLLGFGSFLETKIEKQIESASEEFKKSSARSLFYSKLLALTSARYSLALNEFRGDIARVENVSRQREINVFETSKAMKTEVENADELSLDLKLFLEQLRLRDDFFPVLEKKIDPMLWLVSNYNTPVVPATRAIVEQYGSNSSIYSLTVHPIRNGTLGGEVLDFKFRMLSLQAFRDTYKDLELAFLTSEDVPKVPSYGADEYYKVYVKKLYQKRAQTLAEGYLSKNENALYKKFFDFYDFDHVGI